MSFNNVGSVYNLSLLSEFLDKTPAPEWCKAVCLHHTAAPSLYQRPNGLLIQHIKNMRDFYKEKGWSSGPHFFIDENEIFGMTPVTEKGVHAVSFNSNSIGIEVLGDYDTEFCDSGRGLECWKMTAAVTQLLLKWLKLPVNTKTVLFHRDDPKTTKTCPGTKVQKNWVINMINKKEDIVMDKPFAFDAPRQFVEVAEYMKSIKGYSDFDIHKLLTKDTNGHFCFGDSWLEGAYYSAEKKATIAPVDELKDLPKKKK